MIVLDLSILNQKGTPMFNSDLTANRPAAGIVGRIFIAIDSPYGIFRDTGTAWDQVSAGGGAGISGSGAATQVAFWNGTSSITGSNNLFWDSTNNYLGINTNTPTTALDVHHATNSGAIFNQTTATNNNTINFQTTGIGRWRIGNFYTAGADDFGVFDVVGSLQQFTIVNTTGQTFIGAKTTAAGRLVVNSATADAHLQIVGANAPSIRIDNAGSGGTQRFVFGLATATNNFIQGATAGQFCISTQSSGAMLFGMWQTVNATEAMRISTANNFIVGSIIDTGERVQITGTAKVTSTLTANSFVKSGGTSAQILAADGSVITAGTNITISGGTISSSGGGGGSMSIGGSITGATAGSVLFAGVAGILQQDNANFFWDDTNNRLGIGTTAPATGLQVNGQITINTTGIAGQSAFISTNKPGISNGNNIFIGNGGSALTAAGSTQAANLTGVGFQCLQNNTTGESATAVGFQSMTSNTTGNNNSAFGVGAMYSNTTGQQNTALGFNTLNANISGNYNVAIGNEALKGGTANSENVMIGWRNGYVTTTGAYNTGVGSNALLGITSGQLNVGFGWRAAQSVTSGNYNCAFGGQALNATTGSNNHAFGFSAGQNNTTGSNNIFIGFQTNGVAATDSNRTFIGNDSTVTSWIGGNLILGTKTTTGERLQVTGTVRVNGQTAVSAGGSAGLHLIVNCDGTNYKIALLNI